MIKKIITTLILIPIMLISFSVQSQAYVQMDYYNKEAQNNSEEYEKAYNETYKKFTKKVTATEWGDEYVLSKKLTVREDVVIGRNAKLYLKSDAILIIKGGADFTVYGELIMERGSKLYITDGSLTTIGQYENHGKIIVRETGTLSIIGRYLSGPSSNIKLQGEATVGEKSLNELTEEIKKYDGGFALNWYSMQYTGVGGKITFYYHKGGITTDYYYSYSKGKLKRKDYTLETVYNVKTEKKTLSAADTYMEKNKIMERFSDDKYLFCLEYGFKYNYSTGKLKYEDQYFIFTVDDGNAFIMDNLYEEEIEL